MSEKTEDRVAALRTLAERFRKQLVEIEQGLPVELHRLDGSTVSARLSEAEDKVGIGTEEIRTEAESLVLEAKLKNHDRDSLAKERPQPETFRQWIAALASGRLVVATATASGALASRIVVLALIAGMVGLGAHASGALQLIEHAKTVELGLLGVSNDLSVAAAAAERADDVLETPDCESAGAECAEDSVTEARVRAVFRASAIAALQRDVVGQTRVASSRLRRRAFQLGAVDARRAILATAARPAAPSLDLGAEPVRYHSAAPEVRASTDMLDEAFDRRVRTLRAHEPTWRRLQAWAVRPVSADLAGEAWLRTAVGDVDAQLAHAVRLRAEQASAEFAREVARTGNPHAGARVVASRSPGGFSSGMTVRDRKLFMDFSAEAPDRVAAQVGRYQSGRMDPGSLRRASAVARPGGVGVYENLFPATPSRGATTRVSARSYARVRFSGRVGGVVFGRPPEPQSESVSVVGLDWAYESETGLMLQVTLAGGQAIALGLYHPAIAQHALAYAADGRVVVSTLPQPSSQEGQMFTVPARRVLVHPAFEDTAFACSAIQIDRFVDTFTAASGGEKLPDGLKSIRGTRSGVSLLGYLLGQGRAEISGEQLLEMLGVIQAHAQSCEGDEACFPIAKYGDMGFNFGSAEQLVSCLRDAAAGSGDVSACQEAVALVPSPHNYSVDSGVRELPYVIDPQFAFVTGAGQQGDPLWPMEFMIQAVPQAGEGGDTDVPEGADPWQFPTIAPQIEVAVAAGIAADSGAREVFHNVRDFVVLQRFFRAALDGELGDSFPLQRLVELGAQTRDSVKVVRHERWNVNSAFYDFLRDVRGWTLDELEVAQGSDLSVGCGRVVQNVLEEQSGDSMEDYRRFWGFMATFDGECGSDRAMEGVQRLQQELRHEELIGEALALVVERPAADTSFYCGVL